MGMTGPPCARSLDFDRPRPSRGAADPLSGRTYSRTAESWSQFRIRVAKSSMPNPIVPYLTYDSASAGAFLPRATDGMGSPSGVAAPMWTLSRHRRDLRGAGIKTSWCTAATTIEL